MCELMSQVANTEDWEKVFRKRIKRYVQLLSIIIRIGIRPLLILFTKFLVFKKLGFRKYLKISNLKVFSIPNDISRQRSAIDGGYAIEKILTACSIKLEQFDPWKKKQDVGIVFFDTTSCDFDWKQYVLVSTNYTGKLSSPTLWINSQLKNISKKNVSKIFEQTFGYPLEVNPLKYNGYVVVKSDQNASHDGVIKKAPFKKGSQLEKSKVYNILVNNSIPFKDLVVDLRVIVIGGRISKYTYIKYRSIDTRFSNTNKKVDLRRTSDVFNDYEIDLILRFCKNIRCDYGELDILRDAETKKIYIVDLAKTPAGPPNGISFISGIKSTISMSELFARFLLSDKNTQTKQNN